MSSRACRRDGDEGMMEGWNGERKGGRKAAVTWDRCSVYDC